jgi:hypothetical protein
MTRIRISPADLRVGDVVAGRRVTSLELTRDGVLVASQGSNARELYTDRLIDVKRSDRVAMQALVQANASL